MQIAIKFLLSGFVIKFIIVWTHFCLTTSADLLSAKTAKTSMKTVNKIYTEQRKERGAPFKILRKGREMHRIWKKLSTRNIKTRLEEGSKSSMENAMKSTITIIATWRQRLMFRISTMRFLNMSKKRIVHFQSNAWSAMPSFVKTNRVEKYRTENWNR